MFKTLQTTIATLLLLAVAIACQDDGQSQASDVQFSQVESSSKAPANVTISFKADYTNGDPLANLTDKDFKLYEDNEDISLFESEPRIIRKPTNFASSSVLLLDLSGSVLASNSLSSLKQSAKAFVNTIFANTVANGSYEIAIYWFDGEAKLHSLAEFTNDKDQLIKKIDAITESISTDNSTNLNGAVVEGIDIMNARVTKIKTDGYTIVAGSVVVFTDGTDQAARVNESTALSAVQNAASLAIFSIGLGGEINQDVLARFGKNGHEIASNTDALTTSFTNVAGKINDEANSYYIIQYCSPKRSGKHQLKIVIQKNNRSGAIGEEFDATGFTGGCVVE
jgi:uncharacterized protein YegL